ncbi:hypothetical protein T4D_12975 [Trichinella pseudospiralis]|uniref:DUF4440 domain-containing protein n=1 Tax=Trichinella pseudospiralis TaxID=6337 RepID=A0A0V1G468_TRIPS|nr:hypothetical protein T4D_12975 [Trichinella pseudospiralis]
MHSIVDALQISTGSKQSVELIKAEKEEISENKHHHFHKHPLHSNNMSARPSFPLEFSGLINKELREKLEKRTEDYSKQLINANWSSLDGFFYPTNAKVIFPDGTTINSKEEIVNRLKKESEEKKYQVTYRVEEVVGCDDWAFTRGSFKTKLDKQELDHGKYIIVWRKYKDEYMIYNFIFNSSKSETK